MLILREKCDPAKHIAFFDSPRLKRFQYPEDLHFENLLQNDQARKAESH